MGNAPPPELNEETVRDRLRGVQFPGYQRDVVSSGFVEYIQVENGTVTIDFKPSTKYEEKIQKMVTDIEEGVSLLEGVEKVEVNVKRPYQDELKGGGVLTPLQVEMMEEDVDPPEEDILSESLNPISVGEETPATYGKGLDEAAAYRPEQDEGGLNRPDIATEAGYGTEGPEGELPGPAAGPTLPGEQYEGPIPVFQWEINPQDPSFEGDEGYVELGGWEYTMWWKIHPNGLVYASIHALTEEDQDACREGEVAHPIGRATVANLVYDQNRQGVVAIYGLAKDFRPFALAFCKAFGIADVEESEEGEQGKH